MNAPVHFHAIASVKRVDPRRPAVITPLGLRRIVLGSSEGERLARSSQDSAPKPVRSKGPFSQISLVVSHAERGALTDGARQAIAAAAILASPHVEVVVAVLGACKDDAATLGVDRLLVLDGFDSSRYQPGATVAWLLKLQATLKPAQSNAASP